MRSRETQTEKLLALLLARKGRRVSLPEIQALGIAQYGARLQEIRKLGYEVVNVMEHVNGQIRSWYVLEGEPGEPITSPHSVAKSEPPRQGRLFSDSELHVFDYPD